VAREFIYLIPEIIVLATALLILMLDLVVPDRRKPMVLAWTSVAGLVAAAAFAANLFGERVIVTADMFVIDSFGIVLKMVLLIGSALSILLAVGFLQRPKSHPGEYNFLILASTLGMMIMTGSNNLLLAFLGIQLTSIPLYILAGFKRSDAKSSEAALKYFLLGVLTAALMLYGMSMLYGLTGTLNLTTIAQRLTAKKPNDPVLFLGMVFIIAGFSFKIAAVPFHFWAPDVYEGSPTCVTAFIAAVPKIAGFAVLVRLVYTAFPALTAQWTGLLALMAVLTMVTGNIMAIPQKNIKRMLAFSGIAHVGYMLIALAVPGPNALGALVFYLIAYSAMTAGALTIVVAVGRVTHEHQINSFAGLGSRAPLLAAAMTAFLLSMLGFPLTAGFAGKFLLFGAAIEKHYLWLALVGVVNSVISLYYYFGVVRQMYLTPSRSSAEMTVHWLVWLVIAAALAVTFVMGIYPEPFIHLTRNLFILFARF
jgi:NADH-quinone oxidoreductase subunit N